MGKNKQMSIYKNLLSFFKKTRLKIKIGKLVNSQSAIILLILISSNLLLNSMFLNGNPQLLDNFETRMDDTVVNQASNHQPQRGMQIPGNIIKKYNFRTKQIQTQTLDLSGISPFLIGLNFTQDKPGVDSSIWNETLFDTFSDLSLVADPSIFPYRVTCKIKIYRPGGLIGFGTAILIDSKHVLTAAHCIYKASLGGWPDSITIAPGYNGGSLPYGIGRSIGFFAWAAWVDNEDYNYDMGVIELDRPVGALTGWFGYGYNNNDDFFAQNTFYSMGYPAESPYNGLYQYSWYGSFNLVSTDKLEIYNISFGGQSGSGAYFNNGTNRVIYSVLSQCDTSLIRTSFTRITSLKFNSLLQWISSDTPNSPDLIPLVVELAPQTLHQGDTLTALSYLLHNYSSVSFTGSETAGVYLSTDKVITTNDVLLSTHPIATTIGPKSTIQVFVGGSPIALIPCTTVPGNYYIGIIIHGNSTSKQDVHAVTVLPFSPPAQPGNISGPNSVCKNSTNNYSITDVPGAISYIWTLPSGWSGSSTSTSITSTAGLNGGNILVAANGVCSSSLATIKSVVTNPLPVPTISGTSNTCVNSSGDLYTTEASMWNYNWVVNGGTIINGVGTNSITVTWYSPGTKTITVNYTNEYNCVAAVPTVYSITVHSLPVITLTGPSQQCKGSTGNVYFTDPGMSNYAWAVSSGGIIT